MSSILDMISQQLGGDVTRKLSAQLGADEGSTGDALGAALPVLVSALARNAAKPEGAESLSRALERDHDGSVLDDLGGFLGDPRRGNGAGILGHVLGGRRAAVETGIGKSSGLDSSKVGELLEMAAPLVMGALGKSKRSGGLDAGGLADLLGRERSSVESAAPEASSFLTQLLDKDGDGSIADDVAKAGVGFLGRFLRDR